MKISAAKLQRLKNAGKHHARSAGKGAKGSAIAVGVGAVAEYAGTMAVQKIEMLQKHPYAGPIALAVAGHFGKRKNHDAGTAALGAAGFWAAMTYAAQQGAPAGGQAKGWGDAGAFNAGNPDAGALQFTENASSAAAPSLETASAAAMRPGNVSGYDDAGDMVDEAMGLTS